MNKLLRLYVVGQTPSANAALEKIQAMLSDTPEMEDWELEVIDVLENPEMAEFDRIIAVPALVKKLPQPVRRFFGDMLDRESVLQGLDIIEQNGSKTGS